MSDRFDLTGRVVVVTGGSRGPGRAVVQAFAEHGAEPHEVVGAAVDLASDASSSTTGSVIEIDGGAAFAPG